MNESRRGGVSAPLKWALCASVVLHVGLVALIQDQPGGDPSFSGLSSLDAWIEPAFDTSGRVAASAPTLPSGSMDPRPAAESVPVVQPPSDALARPAQGAPVSASNVARPPTPSPQPAAGMEMPFVRDPVYYAMAALDTPPRLLGTAEPCYPQGAVGEVTYQIAINEQGTVDEASIVSVKPQGLFTGAAIELCSRLKFTPATKDGRTVKSRVRLVVGQPAT